MDTSIKRLLEIAKGRAKELCEKDEQPKGFTVVDLDKEKVETAPTFKEAMAKARQTLIGLKDDWLADDPDNNYVVKKNPDGYSLERTSKRNKETGSKTIEKYTVVQESKELCERKLVKEGVEDKQSELVGEFETLSKKHKNHPDFKYLSRQFKRGQKDFSNGYETEDDDLLDNGLEGMEQAVEELRKLK